MLTERRGSIYVLIFAVGMAFLAVLAATNHAKFGTALPFSYGPSSAGASTSAASYVVLLAAAVGVVAVLWVLTRPHLRPLLARRPWPAVIALVMAVGLLALIPEFRAFIVRLANGAYYLLVDLRGGVGLDLQRCAAFGLYGHRRMRDGYRQLRRQRDLHQHHGRLHLCL